MSRFRVFAPALDEVRLQAGGAEFPMQRNAEGWWESAIDAIPGTDYRFLVGGDALPDPRSAFQPQGVFGPSRVVDHAAFAWTDQHWNPPPLSSAVMYELHVGTFTPCGTFEAAIERLDHLVELGVTHVELMPVAEFPGERGWGYDGVDLFAAHHGYGGPDGLKRLVNACHACGLAVILDVVYNHLGPSGNYLDRFGPYYNRASVTPWGSAINFDGSGSGEVRRFFCDNALMWLRDYHFDGLRLDAIHALVDTSAVHFLEQLSGEVATLEALTGRHYALIAESDLNDPRVVWSREAGGYGMHAQWSDDFHHALHSVLTGERHSYYQDFGSIAVLARALTKAYVYAGEYSVFRGRAHGRPADGLPGWRFLGYLQNHDQIGNRAHGERSAQLMSANRLMIGAALVFTAPFVPMLFQGEEWGASTPFLYFTSHEDPELARAVSEGRRREFGSVDADAAVPPDPQDQDTFERSKLKWDETGADPHAKLHAWHKALIRLRRSEPDLVNGRMDRIKARFDEGAEWLTVRRGALQVICNFSSEATEIPAGDGAEPLLASTDVRFCGGRACLPPESVAILRN